MGYQNLIQYVLAVIGNSLPAGDCVRACKIHDRRKVRALKPQRSSEHLDRSTRACALGTQLSMSMGSRRDTVEASRPGTETRWESRHVTYHEAVGEAQFMDQFENAYEC